MGKAKYQTRIFTLSKLEFFDSPRKCQTHLVSQLLNLNPFILHFLGLRSG